MKGAGKGREESEKALSMSRGREGLNKRDGGINNLWSKRKPMMKGPKPRIALK
jgi:hypothetical protein